MITSPRPQERAEFATTSRLLSCLVTESLTPAFYLPRGDTENGGLAVILKSGRSCSKLPLPDDILAIVPLHHAPVYRPDSTNAAVGVEIGLLDPLDMASMVFEIESDPTGLPQDSGVPNEYNTVISSILDVLNNVCHIQLEKTQIRISSGALSIWNGFAVSQNLDQNTQLEIAKEFSSSVRWQTHSYEYPPEAPLFLSPSIIWEQSIVEGHPTHPMHKTRRFLPPLEDYSPSSYDLLHPKLRFVSLPREKVNVTYDFEGLTLPVLKLASLRAGKDLTVEEKRIAIPVHELQVTHVQHKFPEAYIYPEEFNLPLLAQQSLRSVIVPDAYRGLHLKLGVGVKLTSAVRTISPESAYLGPRFSAQVVPRLTMNRNIVTVARELASVVHAHPNGEIAKHCAAIVRECHEDTSEERCERLIVCTALVESGHAGKDGHLPSVTRVFDLDTEEKCAQWLEKFVTIFLQAFLPPMLHNGVAFECHPQNCVARFDLETKELKGFIVRDFGGLRVHPETLKATAGVEIEFMEGHSIIASTLDDVYTRMYHTIIHNHFQQLIRVLGLHYNGRGWAIVRDQLKRQIPQDHPLYEAWLSPERKTLPGKCFMRMRMSSMYRFVTSPRSIPKSHTLYGLNLNQEIYHNVACMQELSKVDAKWMPQNHTVDRANGKKITQMFFPQMPSGRVQSPHDRASFAVMSRLISCLVTEHILRAFYVPSQTPILGAAGLLVVLSTHTISEDFKVSRAFHTRDIFVIVPLSHKPVLKDIETPKYGQLVGLVDPLDMVSPIFEFRGHQNVGDSDIFINSILETLNSHPWDLSTRGSLCVVSDPVALWKKFVESVVIADNLREVIALELQSSLDWQTLSYENPPLCPDLQSPSIDWEQSLVAGHPTHPMHRARMFLNNKNSLDYDWYNPRIRFVRVPDHNIDDLGQFKRISYELASKAATKAGQSLPIDSGYIYMPVHELQIDNITTVVVPDFPGIALKLAVGVKISSSLRTISHFTANFGPRFSEEVVPRLAVNSAILSVELESSSAAFCSDDPEISKHFTAVIRDEYKPCSGEAVIVCAALLETGHANVPTGISAVQHTFKLDTEEKRVSFLDKYIQIACEALLPALVENGVAFEAHAQNVLARFDIATGELRGFVIRDLGGLRIHPGTLRNSTGVDFQFLPGHCVATKTLEEIYPKFYHTFVHNHIQRLTRLLGLHYNGRGYEMLRKHMGSVIPVDHPVWKVWMDPSSTTVDSKCLMRMRMRDSYRDMVYSPYPNMIQYRPMPDPSTAQSGYQTVTTRLVSYLSLIRTNLFGGK
ncbi:hypothetical protein CVT25_010831 [Psilocybe cyanescens]|uniref:IucC family-domain-containing protein n=1 Tax=Psilocybe cyanescens TaxID=93625 RepID=A0A409WF63_PSICY|nr:hypothetical protein CVT25_010831 [Psilocybe cyanescens]